MKDQKKGTHAKRDQIRKISIKQIENELEFWKKEIRDGKLLEEELHTLKHQVETWCKGKIKLKETYHRIIGKNKEDRKPKSKKRKGRARDRLNIDKRDALKLASWNIRGIQEKPKDNCWFK